MSATSTKRRRLLALALPTLILLPLVAISTFWHRPTRVQLEVVTGRLAFTLDGKEPLEILNRSVPFSSLVIEGCRSASFTAEHLEIADPQQLVPGTQAGETPHFPASSWRTLPATGPVQLVCRDPAAKLELTGPGLLDRLDFAPGSLIILSASGRVPTLSLEIESRQELSLALGAEFELVSQFVRPEGIPVPFEGDVLTWRVHLPEARRTLQLTSGERGLVLIVTPTADQLAELFSDRLDLPLAPGKSVELLEENLEGTITSSLRDQAARLTYPDFPTIPAVILEPEEAVGLEGLKQARMSHLELDAGGALRARFEGVAEPVTRRPGASIANRSLTLFHTFRYSWRWSLLGVAAAWLVSTSWAAVEIWKKLKE